MPSRWVRRTALSAVALLVLAAAAAAWLVASFDAARYKSLAAEYMLDRYQRRLVIAGPVGLSVFPRLAITVRQLTLSEPGQDTVFLSADEAALAVRVLPLLSRRVAVDQVRASGVRATLRRNADGRRNIDDLLLPTARPAAPGGAAAPDASPAKPLDFEVSGVQVQDLVLRVGDARAGLDGTVTLHSLTMGRLAPRTPTPVSFDAHVALQQPRTLELAVGGQTQLNYDAERQALSLTDLKVHVQGEAAGVQGLDLTLDGALGWDAGAASAGPLRVHLAGARRGALALLPSTLSLTRAEYDASQQRLSLHALALAVAGRRGEQRFEWAIDWPELTVERERMSGSPLSGRLQLGGPSSLQASVRSAAPTGSFEALRLPALTLTLNGGVGADRVEGELRADLVLDLDRPALTLDPLDLHGSLAGPGRSPLQLRAAGRARAQADRADWTLQGALDGGRFDSRGQAELGAAVPRVELQARFDTLDLNRLLPARAASAGSAGPAAADPALPFDTLKAVDGTLSLRAGTLAYRQYRVSDATAQAKVQAGTLTVERLSGGLWGGSVDAAGRAQAADRRLALQLQASGVDVDAMLKDLAGKALLEGRGRVRADLRSQGRTVGELRSALAGTASLELRDGAVKGFDLEGALRQARAALKLGTDRASAATAAEKTPFSSLKASARIADGVAESSDLDLRSPLLHIGGAGRFDIGRGTIDYTARSTVVATGTSPGRDDLAALRGVTVPVRLSGPLDAIQWQVQWSGVAASVVKSQLRNRLAEELGIPLRPPPQGAASAPKTPKDPLREVLKGLFR